MAAQLPADREARPGRDLSHEQATARVVRDLAAVPDRQFAVGGLAGLADFALIVQVRNPARERGSKMRSCEAPYRRIGIFVEFLQYISSNFLLT